MFRNFGEKISNFVPSYLGNLSQQLLALQLEISGDGSNDLDLNVWCPRSEMIMELLANRFLCEV